MTKTPEQIIAEFRERFNKIDVNECDYDDEGNQDGFVIVDSNEMSRCGLDSVEIFLINSHINALEGQKESLEGMKRKDSHIGIGGLYTASEQMGHNQALYDVISAITQQIESWKKLLE